MNQVAIDQVEFKSIENLSVVDDSREKINELINAVNRLMAVTPDPAGEKEG